MSFPIVNGTLELIAFLALVSGVVLTIIHLLRAHEQDPTVARRRYELEHARIASWLPGAARPVAIMDNSPGYTNRTIRAHRRARDLLFQSLTAEQRASLEHFGFVRCRGQYTGRAYYLTPERQICDDDRRTYCIAAVTDYHSARNLLPWPDRMLTFVLMIQYNERAFVTVANASPALPASVRRIFSELV